MVNRKRRIQSSRPRAKLLFDRVRFPHPEPRASEGPFGRILITRREVTRLVKDETIETVRIHNIPIFVDMNFIIKVWELKYIF